MDTTTVLLAILAVIAIAVFVWLAMASRPRMRAGKTPPGPPTDVDTGTHDEPDTDYGRLVDEKRHRGRSSEDVGKAARDADRLLGHSPPGPRGTAQGRLSSGSQRHSLPAPE